MITQYYYMLIVTVQILDGVLTATALHTSLFSIYEVNPIVSYLVQISPYLLLVLKLLACIFIITMFTVMEKLCIKYNRPDYYTIGFTVSVFTLLVFSFIGFFTGIFTYISYLGGFV